MTLKALLDNWAYSLSEHAVAVVVVLAVLAWLLEGLHRGGAVAEEKRWAGTWATNGALLGCGLLMSWLLAPWLSPVVSDALSSQTGLLEWLDVANVSYVASIVTGVLLLDLVNYWLHRLLHAARCCGDSIKCITATPT